MRIAFIGLSAATLILIGFAFGPASVAERPEEPNATAGTKGSQPVYRPPLRGATAGGRIGGGTRGKSDRAFTLAVLAPDHIGFTISEHPTLYWFVSEIVTTPVELTVIDDQGSDPILELKLAPPIEPGVHALSLAKHGVRLQPLVRYEWFVALVVDPNQRSSDIVAGGELQRVEAPERLLDRLSRADERSRPGLYARAGIWYEALHGLSELILRAPRESSLKAQRAVLLEQVGLSSAAAYDRSKIP